MKKMHVQTHRKVTTLRSLFASMYPTLEVERAKAGTINRIKIVQASPVKMSSNSDEWGGPSVTVEFPRAPLCHEAIVSESTFGQLISAMIICCLNRRLSKDDRKNVIKPGGS